LTIVRKRRVSFDRQIMDYTHDEFSDVLLTLGTSSSSAVIAERITHYITLVDIVQTFMRFDEGKSVYVR
jgi:hypothetical protein